MLLAWTLTFFVLFVYLCSVYVRCRACFSAQLSGVLPLVGSVRFRSVLSPPTKLELWLSCTSVCKALVAAMCAAFSDVGVGVGRRVNSARCVCLRPGLLNTVFSRGACCVPAAARARTGLGFTGPGTARFCYALVSPFLLLSFCCHLLNCRTLTVGLNTASPHRASQLTPPVV